MPKTKKIICVLLVCLFILPLTFINTFAYEYTVDGVTLDFYSSYFWDTKNGSVRCTPYENSGGYIRFETELENSYTRSHLYVYCRPNADFNLYGTFSITGLTRNGGMMIDESSSGIYLTNSDNTINFDKKLASFELVDNSVIRATCTYEGELPENFIIFLAYDHWLTTEVSVSYFDLSFDQMSEQEIEQHMAESQGNEAVNSLTSIIPSDSQGFMEGFQRLTAAMTYDGTDSKWTFPALYIPAIDGLFDKIELSPEREIDFGYWCRQIPSTLLTLIQYISTIALILYCFYELYDTISYALTLGRKGGGK